VSEKEKVPLAELPEIYDALKSLAMVEDPIVRHAAEATLKIQNRLGQFQCYLLLMILQELRRGRA
jgi:hypothetical protein